MVLLAARARPGPKDVDVARLTRAVVGWASKNGEWSYFVSFSETNINVPMGEVDAIAELLAAFDGDVVNLGIPDFGGPMSSTRASLFFLSSGPRKRS